MIVRNGGVESYSDGFDRSVPLDTQAWCNLRMLHPVSMGIGDHRADEGGDGEHDADGGGYVGHTSEW